MAHHLGLDRRRAPPRPVPKPAQAIAHAQDSLNKACGGQADYIKATAFHTLGSAHAGLGDREQAADHYQRALAAFRKIDMRFEEFEVLVDLGDLYVGQGDAERARDHWQRALPTLVECDIRLPMRCWTA